MEFDITKANQFMIQMDNVELREIMCSKKDVVEGTDYQLDVRVDVNVSMDIDKSREVELAVFVGYNEGAPFSMFVAYIGTFIAEDIDDKLYTRFLETQAIRFIWPYARHLIHETTQKMNITPFLLPTVDTIELMRREEQE